MIDEVSATAKAGEKVNGHLGLDFIDLADIKPDPEALDLVPGDFALQNQVLPLKQDGEVLIVLIGSIEKLRAVDDLGILVGKPVQAALADPNLIRERIEDRFLEGMIADLPGEESTIIDADDSTAGAASPQAECDDLEGARPRCLPAAARCLPSRVHDDAEEAELRVAQGCSRAPDQRAGDQRIHSG